MSSIRLCERSSTLIEGHTTCAESLAFRFWGAALDWYSSASVTEAGSYLRLIDYFITQLEAQGPSRTCNESKEEEEEGSSIRLCERSSTLIEGHTTCADSLAFRFWGAALNWYSSASVTEAGSYLRLIDSFITQLEAQGSSRTCNESKEEEEGSSGWIGTSGSTPPARARLLY